MRMHNFQKEYEKMSPMISYDGIINQNFIDRLEKDIKKYDILFLCAFREHVKNDTDQRKHRGKGRGLEQL